jgi:glycosyltransferase involved in cell wall biosynthesis
MVEEPKAIHIAINHQRYDTRVYHREIKSLVAAGYGPVLLIAADGLGNSEEPGVIIRDIGNRKRQGALPRLESSFRAFRSISAGYGEAVVHVHEPDFLPWALLLALFGRRVVYDAHEDTPAQIRGWKDISPGPRHIAALVVASLEWAVGRASRAIVGATPAILRRYPPPKRVLLRNFPALNAHPMLPRSGPLETDQINHFVFIGGVTISRSIREMVDAIRLVNQETSARLKITGRFMPDGLSHSIRRREGWQFVDYRTWAPYKEALSTLNDALAGLLLYKPVPNHIEALPNKIFEYMSASIPIIASDFPLWRQIIDEAQCGITVNPDDPKEIADAMKWLLDHPREAAEMGQRGRAAVQNKYNWDNEKHKLLALYAQVTGVFSQDLPATTSESRTNGR